MVANRLHREASGTCSAQSNSWAGTPAVRSRKNLQTITRARHGSPALADPPNSSKGEFDTVNFQQRLEA